MSGAGHKTCQGFTLVELLVALALLASLMALALASWTTLNASQSSLLSSIDDLTEQTTRRAILKDSVARALPWIERVDNANQLAFAGDNQTLRMLTARPLIEAGSAYQEWNWRIERADDRYNLEVAVQPFHPAAWASPPSPDWRPLLSFDSEIAFQYLEIRDEVPLWLDLWQERTDMPSAIRLTISDAPPLVMPIYQKTFMVCRSDAAAELPECT